MENMMKLLTALLFVILSTSIAFAQGSPFPLRVSMEITKMDYSSSAIVKFLLYTDRTITRADFEEILMKEHDDSHALNYYEIMDSSFQELIEVVDTACYDSNVSPDALIRLLRKGHNDKEIKSFHLGVVARRVWTEFVYDYYILLEVKGGNLIFAVYNNC
jgi:hypothetical protein